MDAGTDDGAKRLAEVHQLLQDIDADTGPARAAELLYGLGFSTEDQVRPLASIRAVVPKSRSVETDKVVLRWMANASFSGESALLQAGSAHGVLLS